MSTALFSTSIVQDFQDSSDDEEDTRSSQEYMDDLEEEYQARSLLDKSKRFFKRVLKCSAVQKQLTKLNATNVAGWVTLQAIVFIKNSVPSYQSPFQKNSHPRLLSSPQHKPQLMPSKDFEAKYNKVKAKLALPELFSFVWEIVH
ncbi:hypothetical protein Tco_0050425 [Tanacetum coccineum]